MKIARYAISIVFFMAFLSRISILSTSGIAENPIRANMITPNGT